MTSTETLKHEHQVILLVLKGTEIEAQRMEQTGNADIAKVKKIVEFFRNFVDRCHHTKEEKHLFPRLCGSVPQADAPVSVMLREHEEGRRHVAALSATLDEAGPQSVEVIRQHLLAYTDLLRQHIAKEDNVLYPLADRGLDVEDQRLLAEAFEKVEAEEMGAGVHEKYHQLAHELAEG